MFEDLKTKLQGFGFTAIKKTGEVAELASLKAKVIAKKKSIQDSYAELGKAFYEAHKEEAGEFSEKVDSISRMYEELQEFETEISALKEKLQEEMKNADPEEDIFEDEEVSEAVAEPADEAIAEETPVEETPVEETPVEAAADEAVEEVTEEATEPEETIAGEVVEEN